MPWQDGIRRVDRRNLYYCWGDPGTTAYGLVLLDCGTENIGQYSLSPDGTHLFFESPIGNHACVRGPNDRYEHWRTN